MDAFRNPHENGPCLENELLGRGLEPSEIRTLRHKIRAADVWIVSQGSPSSHLGSQFLLSSSCEMPYVLVNLREAFSLVISTSFFTLFILVLGKIEISTRYSIKPVKRGFFPTAVFGLIPVNQYHRAQVCLRCKPRRKCVVFVLTSWAPRCLRICYSCCLGLGDWNCRWCRRRNPLPMGRPVVASHHLHDKCLF